MAGGKGELTGLEFELMQVVWARGASTTGQVQEQLKRELAYTTVQTVLNTLVRKGRLKRRLEGRAYVYSAAISESQALKTAVRRLLDRAFSGSGEALVMSLVQSREIAPERLEELGRRLSLEAAPPQDENAGPAKSARPQRKGGA